MLTLLLIMGYNYIGHNEGMICFCRQAYFCNMHMDSLHRDTAKPEPWTGLMTTITSFLRQRTVLDDLQITRCTLPSMTRVQICTCVTIQWPHSRPCE